MYLVCVSTRSSISWMYACVGARRCCWKLRKPGAHAMVRDGGRGRYPPRPKKSPGARPLTLTCELDCATSSHTPWQRGEDIEDIHGEGLLSARRHVVEHRAQGRPRRVLPVMPICSCSCYKGSVGCHALIGISDRKLSPRVEGQLHRFDDLL